MLQRGQLLRLTESLLAQRAGILASIGPWRIHLHRHIPPQGVDSPECYAIRARAKDFLDDDTGHMNNMALGPRSPEGEDRHLF